MNPINKMVKLQELKNQLNVELAKENKDLELIQRLHGKIVQLGLTLTTRDIINRRNG